MKYSSVAIIAFSGVTMVSATAPSIAPSVAPSAQPSMASSSLSSSLSSSVPTGNPSTVPSASPSIAALSNPSSLRGSSSVPASPLLASDALIFVMFGIMIAFLGLLAKKHLTKTNGDDPSAAIGSSPRSSSKKEKASPPASCVLVADEEQPKDCEGPFFEISLDDLFEDISLSDDDDEYLH